MLDRTQLKELVLQSLEHEMGGVKVYEAALKCVRNETLRQEWEKYLDQTREHVEIMKDICKSLGVSEDEETPGRQIVRDTGRCLVGAIETAANGDPAAAEIVATEAVVLAETKDHLDWELLGEACKELEDDEQEAVEAAIEKVEDEEDEHLYHTQGWCRELWIKSLGLTPVLPPPEEQKDVKTAIGAARARSARKRMARKVARRQKK